jgi:hypothetical protein
VYQNTPSTVLNPCLTRGFKGTSAAPRLRRRALRVSALSPTRMHTQAKQPPIRVTPRSPWNTDLQRLCAVMMERSRPSRRPKCPCPLLRPHLPWRPRLPRRSIHKLQRLQSHIKSSRASLQLTHELGGYIRRMRSLAPTENIINTRIVLKVHLGP